MKYKKKIMNSIFFLIFLTMGLAVRNSSKGILFDAALLEFFGGITNPIVFKTMKLISYLGSEKFLIPIMFIIILFNLIKRNISDTILLLINTLGSFILNSIIKQIFQRTRPLDFSLVKQGGLSYPSGHSMVVMSMYLTIFWILTRNEESKSRRYLIGTVIGIYILFMGISRLYLGVHWPTDIIGGYICGYLLYDSSKKIIRK